MTSPMCNHCSTQIAYYEHVRSFSPLHFNVIAGCLQNIENHCSPQRHTILLLDFLLSSWPQSAKTYDLKKHVLSYLLHLTNTIIAVCKDIQYCFSIFPCVRNKTQPLQSAKTYDLLKHLLSDILHLTNTIIAVRSPTLNKHNHCSLQRHTILLLDFPLCS